MFKRFLCYGILGIFLEITWTSLYSLTEGDYSLYGHSSFFMFFIYGMVVFLEPVFEIFKKQNVLVRTLTYAALIFTAEYFSGSVLKYFGICPWVYTTRFNINGLIRIDYIFIWITAGYIYERLYFYFSSHNILKR